MFSLSKSVINFGPLVLLPPTHNIVAEMSEYTQTPVTVWYNAAPPVTVWYNAALPPPPSVAELETKFEQR
jgi:hypothetical protein